MSDDMSNDASHGDSCCIVGRCLNDGVACNTQIYVVQLKAYRICQIWVGCNVSLLCYCNDSGLQIKEYVIQVLECTAQACTASEGFLSPGVDAVDWIWS